MYDTIHHFTTDGLILLLCQKGVYPHALHHPGGRAGPIPEKIMEEEGGVTPKMSMIPGFHPPLMVILKKY
jgi:hypothetical protein